MHRIQFIPKWMHHILSLYESLRVAANVIHKVNLATDVQANEKIYLFIVTTDSMKSTYPVMFVMIFDNILLEGILE